MTATIAATPAVDPVLARAQFFFDLELDELRAVIPQAAPVRRRHREVLVRCC